MPAGTIKLTNNSTAVTGSGTAFATELKANDFLVAIVGGTTYTLGVKSVESATALTLTTAYGGPTAGGLAWTPIPNGTLVGITAQIAADTARAIRGLNYDKQNWQQVYSASGNITVTLPDGSTYTGPSWLNLSSALAGKANSNDTRLGTVDGKTGGSVSGSISSSGDITAGQSGNYLRVQAYGGNSGNSMRMGNNNAQTVAGFVNSIFGAWYNGSWELGGIRGGSTDLQSCLLNVNSENTTKAGYQFTPMGTAYAASWSNTSDERLKDIHGPIENPLEKMKMLRGVTWNFKYGLEMFGVGFIAQEVAKVFPDAVTKVGLPIALSDGSFVDDPLAINAGSIAAGLHHEAILVLMDKIEELESTIKGGASRDSDNDQ